MIFFYRNQTFKIIPEKINRTSTSYESRSMCCLSNGNNSPLHIQTCTFYSPGDRWSFSIWASSDSQPVPQSGPVLARDRPTPWGWLSPRLFWRWTMGEIKIQSDMPRCHAATPTTFYLFELPHPFYVYLRVWKAEFADFSAYCVSYACIWIYNLNFESIILEVAEIFI